MWRTSSKAECSVTYWRSDEYIDAHRREDVVEHADQSGVALASIVTSVLFVNALSLTGQRPFDVSLLIDDKPLRFGVNRLRDRYRDQGTLVEIVVPPAPIRIA